MPRPEAARANLGEVVVVLPFHPGLRRVGEAVDMLVTTARRLSRHWPNILVMEDGVSLIPESNDYTRIRLPRNVGKVAAVREAFASSLSLPGVQFFCAMDFDDEQEQDDITSLLTRVVSGDLNAAVSNRYAYFPRSQVPLHRRLANDLNLALAQALGFDVTDLAAAMVACDRTFASIFTSYSRSGREGIGFDWLSLAFLQGQALGNAPVRAKMRSLATNGGKLARNYAIPLNYRRELEAAGAGAVVDFCAFYVQALEGGGAAIRLPVELLGARGEVTLLRQSNGTDYSYDGYIELPGRPSGISARAGD